MNATEPPPAPTLELESHAPPGFDVGMARPGDIESIFRLIDGVSRASTVLPRSRESIASTLDGFMVARRGERVVACGALHYTQNGLGEIRSLAVDPEFRSHGLGGALVLSLIGLGRRLELWRVFVLTDSVEFFRRQGFTETPKETLPHKVWNDCLQCPKLFNCGEIAMDVTLNPAPAAVPFEGLGWPLG